MVKATDIILVGVIGIGGYLAYKALKDFSLKDFSPFPKLPDWKLPGFPDLFGTKKVIIPFHGGKPVIAKGTFEKGKTPYKGEWKWPEEVPWEQEKQAPHTLQPLKKVKAPIITQPQLKKGEAIPAMKEVFWRTQTLKLPKKKPLIPMWKR